MIVFGSMGATLKDCGKATAVGFGIFSISPRRAGKVRNLHTGKEIKIAAKKPVEFSDGKKLKTKVAR